MINYQFEDNIPLVYVLPFLLIESIHTIITGRAYHKLMELSGNSARFFTIPFIVLIAYILYDIYDSFVWYKKNGNKIFLKLLFKSGFFTIFLFSLFIRILSIYVYIPYSLYIYLTSLMIVFYFQRKLVDKLRAI